jgi:hypothetical protein
MTEYASFKKFIGTDFERDILPIIPVGALLKPYSALSAEHLGRILGICRVRARGWGLPAG